MNAETIHQLLVGCLLGLYILAMFNLRRRRLTLGQLTAWGLLALMVPALGPFLVILNNHGGPAHSLHPRGNRR